MITIDYDLLKIKCQEEGLHVLESTYIGDGILGKFFAPNIILIDSKLCDKLDIKIYGKQKKTCVLLHQICHWIKWKEHKEDYTKHDEEDCFEFEIICSCILNDGYSIDYNFEAIKRLNLYKPMIFLKEVIKECQISDEEEINSMTRDEYNNYLNDFKEKEKQKVIHKISLILDQAYKDYIKTIQKR